MEKLNQTLVLKLRTLAFDDKLGKDVEIKAKTQYATIHKKNKDTGVEEVSMLAATEINDPTVVALSKNAVASLFSDTFALDTIEDTNSRTGSGVTVYNYLSWDKSGSYIALRTHSSWFKRTSSSYTVKDGMSTLN